MLAYLKKRHINVGMIRAWRIHYSAAGPYAGRVVFPVLGDSGVEFFVARSIDDKEPKTLHPSTGNLWTGKKGGAVWGLDRVPDSGEVVVCEGVFDAAVVPGGVAVMGKTITQQQVMAIGLRVRSVTIMLDGDAQEEAQEMKRAFLHQFPRLSVRVVRLPENVDPSDVGPEGAWQILHQ
jgi:DNA primase